MSIMQQKYIVLLGAFVVQLTLGGFYTAGSFQSKIAHFISNRTNTSFNDTMKTSTWIFGAMSLGMGSSMSFGGFMDSKIGTIWTVLFGGGLICLNTGLMITMVKQNLWLIIITYGFLGGVGVGIVYGVTLGTIAKIFTEKKGLIFGITLSGYGLSALFQDVIQNYEVKNNVESTFMYMTIFCTVMLFVGVILLGFKKKIKIEESHSIYNSVKYDIFNSYRRVTKEFKPHQIILEYDFWMLWLIMTAVSAVDNIVMSFYSSNFNQYKIDKFTLSVVFTISNSIGRIFWGFLVDIKPFKCIMIILLIINSIFLVSLPFVTSALKIYIIIVLWYSVIGFQLGGFFAIFPTICANLFGTKHFTINYGMLYTANSLPGCIICLVSMNFDFSSNFLQNAFIIAGAISLLGAILSGLFRGKSLITHNTF